MLETKNSTVEGCGIEILEPRAVNSHETSCRANAGNESEKTVQLLKLKQLF